MNFSGLSMHFIYFDLPIPSNAFNSIKYVAGEKMGVTWTKNSYGNNSSKLGKDYGTYEAYNFCKTPLKFLTLLSATIFGIFRELITL